MRLCCGLYFAASALPKSKDAPSQLLHRKQNQPAYRRRQNTPSAPATLYDLFTGSLASLSSKFGLGSVDSSRL